jgi:hypothetical protein
MPVLASTQLRNRLTGARKTAITDLAFDGASSRSVVI